MLMIPINAHGVIYNFSILMSCYGIVYWSILLLCPTILLPYCYAILNMPMRKNLFYQWHTTDEDLEVPHKGNTRLLIASDDNIQF